MAFARRKLAKKNTRDFASCSLDMIPYPGRGMRSARAMSVGSQELGRETE